MNDRQQFDCILQVINLGEHKLRDNTAEFPQQA